MTSPPLLDPAPDPRELIRFRIGEQDFCVGIMSVREIRGWTVANPLPGSAGLSKGVVNLRGTVPHHRPGAAVRPSLFRAYVATRHHGRAGRRLCRGLLVDAVSEIILLGDPTIQATPKIAGEETRAYVSGLFMMGGRMVSLIDLDRLMTTARLDVP